MTKKEKVAVAEQDPKARSKNFDEVVLGYTSDQAIQEAQRCLQCKNPPCVKGCPVNVRIPEFIKCIREGNFDEGYGTIKMTNSLPAVCGRVCPQEEQCEKVCVMGRAGEPVAIGRLERFVSDYAMKYKTPEKEEINKNHIKAAVVGSGPASLTCAGDLAKMGYDVTVFEALHECGGVMVYGIPEFRLPKSIVRQEIRMLEDLGVKLMTNVLVGKTIEISELFVQGYEAIFIGSGAGLPKFMGIPGENLNGVSSANEYLTRINLMKAYEASSMTPVRHAQSTVVVGGGNVAMDAARCALRMGSAVKLLYRRSMEEMPARKEEIHHAVEEGVEIMTLMNPVEITGKDGWVTGIRVEHMELGEPDAGGRRRPLPTGRYTEIPADQVIMAIGTSPNPLLVSATEGLETEKWGGLKVDEETQATSIPGVFSGGDAVTGAATVIKAMGAGKRAAAAMDEYIKAKK